MPGRGHGRLPSGSAEGDRSPYIEPWSRRHPDFMDNYNRTHSSGRGRGRGISTNSGRGRGRGRGNIAPLVNSTVSNQLGQRDSNSNDSRTSPKNNAPQPVPGTSLAYAYEMPSNSDEIAQDFDEICDLMHTGAIKINDYLTHVFGFDPQNPDYWPEPPKGANMYIEGLFPSFPSWPSKGNPFQLLPLRKRGYFPFDLYGERIFRKEDLKKWFDDPNFSEELFEIQFRELLRVLKFNGKWSVECGPSDCGSYGTCKIFSRVPKSDDSKENRPIVESKDVDQSKATGTDKSEEPDSGFCTDSFENIVDPRSIGIHVIEPNDYSWEPKTGSGFVKPDDRLSEYEHSVFLRSQVLIGPNL